MLYFTGFSDVLFTEKMLLWEHEAFIEKPVGVKALLEAVPVGVKALLEAVSLLLFGHTQGVRT